MITISKQGRERLYERSKYIQVELRGLSTDTKPVGDDQLPLPLGNCDKNLVENGSIFIEIDTGDIYMYNIEGASGEEWIKI